MSDTVNIVALMWLVALAVGAFGVILSNKENGSPGTSSPTEMRNHPWPENVVCIKGVVYFSEKLTPVYTTESKVTLCEEGK